jgi:hypothetical protein
MIESETDTSLKSDPVQGLLDLIERDPAQVQAIIDSLQAEQRLADMRRAQVRRSVARRDRQAR